MKAAFIVALPLAAFALWTLLVLAVGSGIREDSPLWICQLMGNRICG